MNILITTNILINKFTLGYNLIVLAQNDVYYPFDMNRYLFHLPPMFLCIEEFDCLVKL